MATLELNDLTKIYDDAQGREVAVDSLDIDIDDGEFLVLVGPSGCGNPPRSGCSPDSKP
nr:hypothetical protein [Haladaptatus sp. W1]